MQAGDFNKRVRIEQAVQIRSASGAFTTGYVPWISCWASIEDLNPREYWAAQQIQSEITTRIVIRYRPGLNAKCRVIHQRRSGSPSVIDYYDVEGPPLEKRGQGEIHLMCVKRDAKGFRIGQDSAPAAGTIYRVDNPDLRVDDPNWRVDSV